MPDARKRVQVDGGHDDAITPEATMVDVPVLLDLPAPRLRAYPREAIVAEKLGAMALLGTACEHAGDAHGHLRQ